MNDIHFDMIRFTKIILFSIILLPTISYSQGILRKWDTIMDDGLKSVSVDTTSIKQNGNQVSFWILEEYKSPQDFSESNVKIKKIKSQYLINTATSRYSIIGKLYYDDTGKMIGESSSPRLSGGGESFYITIQPNSLEDVLLSRINQYLDEDSYTIEDFSMANAPDSLADAVDSTAAHGQDTSQSVVAAAAVAAEEPAEAQEQLPAESNVIIPVRESAIDDSVPEATVRIYDTSTGEYIELVDSSRSAELAAVTGTGLEESSEAAPAESYDVSVERNVTSTIYTNGKLYCFQVSSWKTKSIADQEVERLKQGGHNAYLVAARPKHKRGTWHRVRVGFFYTLNEAKAAEKRTK